MTWAIRTQSDFNNTKGAGDLPDLSRGSVPEQMWEDVRVYWGYAALSEWHEVDLGHGLLDMFQYELQWLVFFRARGRGYGSTGTYQLALPPDGFDPADIWAAVRSAQDEQGWIHPDRLPDTPPRTGATGYSAGAVRRAYEQLVDGKKVVLLPLEESANAIARLLEIVPVQEAEKLTWSTCHLPKRRVERPTVSGVLEPEFTDPLRASWELVLKDAGIPEQHARSDHYRLAIDHLLDRQSTSVPRRVQGSSFQDQLTVADKERPRSIAEIHAALNVDRMQDDAKVHPDRWAMLQSVPPGTVTEWIRANPAFGRMIFESDQDRAKVSAYEALKQLAQSTNPFGLPVGPPFHIRTGLRSFLMGLSVELRRDLMAEHLAGLRLYERAQKRPMQPLLHELGLTAENSPDLFDVELDTAARVLAPHGGEEAFAQHLAGLSRAPEPGDIMAAVDLAKVTSAVRIGNIALHLARYGLVQPGSPVLVDLGLRIKSESEAVDTTQRRAQIFSGMPDTDEEVLRTKLCVLATLMVPDRKAVWAAAQGWFPSLPGEGTAKAKEPPRPAQPAGSPPQQAHASHYSSAGRRSQDVALAVLIFGGLIVFVVVLLVLILHMKQDPSSGGNEAPGANRPSTTASAKPAYTVLSPTRTADYVLEAGDDAFDPPTVPLMVGDRLGIDGSSLSNPTSIRINQRSVGLVGSQSLVIRFDKPGTYTLTADGFSSPECIVSVVAATGAGRLGQ